MKQLPAITAGVLALLITATSPLPSAGSDPVGMIVHANSVIMDRSASREAQKAAMIEILDASLLILPKDQSTDECRSRIEGAKAEFDQKSLFTDKGYQYLSLAYRLLASGKEWQFPEEIRGAYREEDIMARAKTACQTQIDSAMSELQAGRNQDCVRKLLGYVLTVITPVGR